MRFNKENTDMLSARDPSVSRILCQSALFVALLGLAGCGGGHPTAPIHGKVTLAGRPIGPGLIVLEPESAPGDYSVRSTTVRFGEDGVFAAHTPVGKHRVIIQSLQNEEAVPRHRRLQAASPEIPLYYADPAVSQLTAQVTTDGENELVFDLKPLR